MREPVTFETQLADAYRRLVEPVDVDVDALALTAAIAGSARPGRWSSILASVGMTRRTLQLGLVLLLLLLLALLLTPFLAGRRPLPPPFGVAGNGLVAWADGGDIYAGDAFSGGAHLLIAAPGVEHDPGFSPDGTHLVMIRDDPGGLVDLEVVGVDGRDLRTVTPSPLADLAWFDWMPDSRALLVVSSSGGRETLSILPIDGSSTRTIDFDGDVYEPMPRPPDGSEILFRGRTDAGTGLYVAELASGRIRTIVAPRNRGNTDRDLRESRWSPDGSTIALQAWGDANGTMTVWTVPAAGGVPTMLTHDPRAWYEGWPRWSPDGRRIAILRLFVDPAGNESLLEQPVAIVWVDGHAPTIESGPVLSGNSRIVDWSPDGRWLIERSDDNAQVLVDPDGGPYVRLPWTTTAPATWQRVATCGTGAPGC
jgi:Tol biopolymer transport system component